MWLKRGGGFYHKLLIYIIIFYAFMVVACTDDFRHFCFKILA
jgi:hypothetical protein